MYVKGEYKCVKWECMYVKWECMYVKGECMCVREPEWIMSCTAPHTLSLGLMQVWTITTSSFNMSFKESFEIFYLIR